MHLWPFSASEFAEEEVRPSGIPAEVGDLIGVDKASSPDHESPRVRC